MTIKLAQFEEKSSISSIKYANGLRGRIYKMKVTVVIPVFNRTTFLRSAITSVLQQTFQSFEIIVVDDGSNNGKEIQDLAESFNDERIRYLRKHNGGVASALNLGINQMRGEYFAWLSDDDLFNEFHLEIAVTSLSDYKIPSIHFSNWETIDVAGHKIMEVDAYRQLRSLVTDLGPVEQGLISAISTVISKSVFEVIGTFDERLKYVQDYEFFLRAGVRNIPWDFSSYVSAGIRIHKDQATNFIDSNDNEEEIFWENLARVGANQIIANNESKKARELLIQFRENFQKKEYYSSVNYLDSLLLRMYK